RRSSAELKWQWQASSAAASRNSASCSTNDPRQRMYTATDELRREELLDEVIAAYLNEEAKGVAPTLRELLSRYPDLAEDLEQFFINREKVARFATPLRAVPALGLGRHGA